MVDILFHLGKSISMHHFHFSIICTCRSIGLRVVYFACVAGAKTEKGQKN